MASRWLVLAGSVALGLAVSACAEEARPQRSEQTRLIETKPARCAVGERPRYFVPATSPPALLGCARLGVSGKRVDFSGSLSPIDGDFHFCVIPAYSGRGQRGFFIPTVCMLPPPLARFAIRDASQPRQGVRGYQLVIWGTAPAATSEVLARFDSGRARAVVIKVPSNRAPWTFGESPFSLFVVELPLAAACGSVTVTGDGPGAIDRIPPRTGLCERARQGG